MILYQTLHSECSGADSNPGQTLWLGQKKFWQVCWSVAFVCLSLCFCQFSRLLGTVFKQSFWNFFLCVGDQPRTATLNFVEDPNPDPDLRIFEVILHHWEIGPQTFYSMISQKVLDGFTWNLMDRLGVWQGRIDSILMKIQIRIRIWKLFKWFFTIERWSQKLCIAWDLKKLWTSCDKTRWMSWFGDKNKPIRFWLKSGFRSDPSVAYKI